MTYLDYLPDTPYADLPAAAQAEISAAEYDQLQVLGSSLAEPAGLPSALGSALAGKVSTTLNTPSASAKTIGVHAGWKWVAVLSSFAFLGLAYYSFFFSASAKTSNIPVAKAPTPQTIERVVIQRDTVEQVVRDTVTLFRTKVEIREVRDTVYLRRDVQVASSPQLDSDESQVASKSLSTGLNWGELTVRGGGSLGRD